MAPKIARGAAADVAASPPTSSSSKREGRVAAAALLLQGLLLLHLATASAVASIDEFMTCDRILEKKRTARLLDEIPCDMGAKSYCEHKGKGYPEAQIWRFKEENRALMRRLYGDLESNSVYREMRASNMASAAASAKAKQSSSSSSSSSIFPLDHDLFPSLEYNIRLGSGLATVQGSREQVVGEASKRRPPMKKVKLIKKKRLKKKPSTTEGSEGSESTTAEGGSEDKTPQATHSSGSTAQSQVPGFTQILAGVNLDSLEKYVGEILPQQGSENTESQNAAEPIAEAAAQVSAAGSSDDMEEYDYEEVIEEVEVEAEDGGNVIGGGYNADGLYTGPSENACPVKEEVLAPYWANNTRDQVLALLNLYPFEQYIHMETCKFPEEEMMCRKGCRCEQQYRLHRLLAFDPSNECRGIFSDWFRFPSYCICKCYNAMEETFLFGEERNPPRTRAEKSIPQTKAVAEELDEEEEEDGEGPIEHRNIPAILPYEVKEALLRDMREEETKPPQQEEKSQTSTTPKPAVSDNVVDVTEESADAAAKKQAHFFYGNAPVLEYRLSDGAAGAVQKTPR